MDQMRIACLGALAVAVSACSSRPTNRATTDELLPADNDTYSDGAQTDDNLTGDQSTSDESPGDSQVGDSPGGDDSVTDSDLPPQGPNVIANGSFEQWSAGLPVGWVGATTNLISDSIVEDVSASHDGVRACQLINTDPSTHQRFSTQAFDAAAGDYSCRYWVWGTGEIRNAHYDGDYSGYSGYTVIDTDTWTEIAYSFHLAVDVPDVFELIFSIRNTSPARGHLHLDDVSCTRTVEPCDSVICEAWQACDNATSACNPLPGRCDQPGDCAEWQECDGNHDCVPAAGRCESLADCGEPTPVCSLDIHTCVAGDPCAAVVCDEWKQCVPESGACGLKPGRCMTTADCVGAAPACAVATHTCMPIDDAVNVIPNGGFETWANYSVGGATTYLLPDYWFGLCDACSPYFPGTEMDPLDVLPYTSNPFGGATACKLVEPSQPAKRFTTEPFTVDPTATYSCAYRVRGHGSYRHRYYCGAWATNTTYTAIDTTDWQRIPFDLKSPGGSSQCVFIFYASNTLADKDHLQLDDVVCTRKFAP